MGTVTQVPIFITILSVALLVLLDPRPAFAEFHDQVVVVALMELQVQLVLAAVMVEFLLACQSVCISPDRFSESCLSILVNRGSGGLGFELILPKPDPDCWDCCDC